MRLLRYLSASVLLSGFLALWLGGCSDKSTDAVVPPSIETTPDLVYREVNFGSNPAAQWVVVRNAGEGSMRYVARIASGNTWIGLYQSTDAYAPDSFIVNFQLGATQAGTYLDTVIIESPVAGNSPYLLPVRLVIRNILEVSPEKVGFAMASGGEQPDPQPLVLNGNSTTPIDISLTHSSTWLTLDQDMIATPDTVTMTASGLGLNPGVYYDTILLNAPTIQAPITVPCSLVVASWLTQPLANQWDLRDIHFVDANRGFAVGALGDASGGGFIVHTIDGGGSWTLNNVPDQAVGNVSFVDQDNGWAVGSRQLLRTRNGSADSPIWTTQAISDSVNGVCFIDTTFGWLVGKDGFVLRTINGGASWTEINPVTSFSLMRVQFVSPDSGWAVGNHGVILATSDSGLTWTTQDWGGTFDLNDVSFTDNLNGWVVGAFGTALHTSDAGETWSPVTASTTAELASIWVSPGGRIWMVGSDGTIVYSDNGSPFAVQPTGVTAFLKSVFFLDENSGWAVGWDGMILHTTGGGL